MPELTADQANRGRIVARVSREIVRLELLRDRTPAACRGPLDEQIRQLKIKIQGYTLRLGSQIPQAAVTLALMLAGAVCHAQQPMPIYLFAGQSNQNGSLGNVALPFATPFPSVWSHFKTNQGPVPRLINESTELTPLGSQGSTGGPELSFAQALLQRGADPFAIVKVTGIGIELGGTGDSWNPALTNRWYADLLRKTHEMIDDLTALDYAPHVAGVFWVQGESDAGIASFAAAYETNLTALIAGVRTEFATDAPFYFNRLHSGMNPFYAFRPEVIAAQDAVAANVAGAHLLLTDDLELKADQLHYSNDATLEIGRRFADFVLPSGDFDGDGSVDADDLALWATGSIDADGNSDGMVDGADFLVWQQQASLPAAVAAVPEPAAAWLLAIGVLAMGVRR